MKPGVNRKHERVKMAKIKKELTSAQKRAKKSAKAERQKKYMWVFMNGKQVRVKRPPTIDGMSVDEFIEQHADPIWLHQNEMLECIQREETNEKSESSSKNEDLRF